LNYQEDMDEVDRVEKVGGCEDTGKQCRKTDNCFDNIVAEVMQLESLVDEIFNSIDRIKTEECQKRTK